MDRATYLPSLIAIAGALLSGYFGSRWGAAQALRLRDFDNRREASDALWAYWLALRDLSSELYSREERDGSIPISRTNVNDVAAARKTAARHARGLRSPAREVVLNPSVPDGKGSGADYMETARTYKILADMLERELEREFGDRTWTRDGLTMRWLRSRVKSSRSAAPRPPA